MKKLLFCTAAALGFAGAASAADLPPVSSPPVYTPVPVFTWTGFYVGVNAGYAWTGDDNNDRTVLVPAGALSTALTPNTPVAGTFVNTFGLDNSRNGDGFTFGGTIGYNWQVGGFVVSVEGDINWVDIGGSGNDAFFGGGFNTVTFAGSGLPINRTYDIVSASRSSGFDWFGTARVRLGWAIDRTLIFATGGVAFASGGEDNNAFGLGFGCGGGFGCGFSNDDGWRTGWALGGGVEYAFTNNLTAKIEGLWVSLDGGNRGGAVAVPVPGNLNPATFLPSASKNDNEFFVARLGINYKFGWY
jgi:outer membrane immunogenic protein